MLVYGLDEDKPLFLTPNIILAIEASRHHIDGIVLEVKIPRDIYDHAVHKGYFAERNYIGVILIEGCQEVEVNPGEGIKILSRYLKAFPYFY